MFPFLCCSKTLKKIKKQILLQRFKKNFRFDKKSLPLYLFLNVL
jgi:hypothetical protein